MSMQTDRVIAVRTNKTVYRRGDTVAKVFNQDFSKTDILNEALNQARVEETGLNIPKVLEVTKSDGKWAIVSEWIPGKTLQQLMRKTRTRPTAIWTALCGSRWKSMRNGARCSTD